MNMISYERLAELDNSACDQVSRQPDGLWSDMSASEAHSVFTELQSLRAQGGVRIRPLEWASIGPKGSDVEAVTPLGTYTMSFDAPTAGGGVNLWMAGADNDTFTVHENRRGAKSAAQADYERRILSSLEASPAPVSEHPDDLAVDRFAAAMKAKLAKKREEGRGGWEDKDECSAEFLSKLLREHVEKGDPLDVGNLAMMLHQRGDAIAPAPVSEEMVRSGARGIWDAGATGLPFEMAPTAVVDVLMKQSRAALTTALAAKGGQ